jgi:alcohol dehydrogenase (NADP+)
VVPAGACSGWISDIGAGVVVVAPGGAKSSRADRVRFAKPVKFSVFVSSVDLASHIQWMYAASMCPAFSVDPASVPRRVLQDGAYMPAIGFGTFGSDFVPAAAVARAVAGAWQAGYRHFDCAAVYGNEREIGEVLGGLPRQQLWVTSKLWNDQHEPAAVRRACERSIADLQVGYLDAYLVHWPFRNAHAANADASSRDPDAGPYIHEQFMETWSAMERLVDDGLVRYIGTSNMTVAKLRLLLNDARIGPALNEAELHPHFQQPELFEWLRAHHIEPIGFCPLGSPARPERDRSPEDSVDLEDPVITSIARAHGVHPAAVCLKWAVQRGQTPIPFSTNPDHYIANLQAVVDDPLTEEEMSAIAGVDQGNRLIKGHVFLWRDGQSWRDLWDEDGTIAH